MSIVWLCRYICGVFVLLFVSGLLISYAPNAETFMFVHQVSAGCGAFSAALAAIWLNRLPPNHWALRSRPIWIVFVALALGVTIFIVSVG